MKTTNFLQKCIGISLVAGALLFGAGFLIRSVQTAQAAPTPDKFITEGTSKIGKYQICIGTSVSGESVINNTFVWDTETGKSVYYFYKLSTDTWEKGAQLPANPIGN